MGVPLEGRSTIARITASGTPAVFSSVRTVGLVSKLVADDFTFATMTSAVRPALTMSRMSLFVKEVETDCGLAAALGSWEDGKATTAKLTVRMSIEDRSFFMGHLSVNYKVELSLDFILCATS